MKLCVRFPLSKKSFPVFRVGKKTASREVGNFFFSPNFIFLQTRIYRGEKLKKTMNHYGRTMWHFPMASLLGNTIKPQNHRTYPTFFDWYPTGGW